MAEISFRELVRIIREHPDYSKRWLADVDAKEALYISLCETAAPPLESETFDGADGSLVVLDRDSNGLVRGIEIT
jgi:uncharacterized protein YuzE